MRSNEEVIFALTTGGLFFGLGLFFVLGQAYLACFQIKKIIGYLSNSRGVLLRKPIMNGSIFGVHFMLISIGAILMAPASAIKCGNLDAKDYSNFPRGLLYLIRFVYGAGLAGAASMMTLFFGGKIMGWIQ